MGFRRQSKLEALQIGYKFAVIFSMYTELYKLVSSLCAGTEIHLHYIS